MPARLTALTFCLWVTTATILAAGLLLPYRLPPTEAPAIAIPTSRPATTPAITFDNLLDLNLRRPLVDPPTSAPTIAVAPVTPNVRLAGIVTEPGHSFAVFVTAAGTTEVRTVGQRTGGAEVLAISPAGVTLRFAGRTTTMRLPAPPTLR